MPIRDELTIYFDGAFYQALFTSANGTELSIAKLTLGTQVPSNAEVQLLENNQWNTLRWTTVADVSTINVPSGNALKRSRKAKKQIQWSRSLKGESALKAEHAANLLRKEHLKRQAKDDKKNLVREVKEAKRRAKHKGH